MAAAEVVASIAVVGTTRATGARIREESRVDSFVGLTAKGESESLTEEAATKNAFSSVSCCLPRDAAAAS